VPANFTEERKYASYSQKPESDSKTLLASIGTLSVERQGTLTLPSRVSLVVLTYILNFPKPTLREPFSGPVWSYRGNSEPPNYYYYMKFAKARKQEDDHDVFVDAMEKEVADHAITGKFTFGPKCVK
jgi:hypothetical protein